MKMKELERNKNESIDKKKIALFDYTELERKLTKNSTETWMKEMKQYVDDKMEKILKQKSPVPVLSSGPLQLVQPRIKHSLTSNSALTSKYKFSDIEKMSMTDLMSIILANIKNFKEPEMSIEADCICYTSYYNGKVIKALDKMQNRAKYFWARRLVMHLCFD